MNASILLSLLLVTNAQAFCAQTICHHHNNIVPSATSSSPTHIHPITSLRARPKSKWDDLTDEDDEESNNNMQDNVPSDMLYTEANIRRQLETYDQLESIGGQDVINDVYVRAPGEKEWWLVGKVARITDVSPEQAIERQWPLIERHVWALRIPVRPTSNLSTPFEVWYAPGDSERCAAQNDPTIKFTKVSNLLSYDGADIPAPVVGFVGKTYDERRGEPLFFVERNVIDGTCLRGREMEGEWMLKSELVKENDDDV